MTRLIDITGQRFTRLLVKEYTEGKKWLCVCDCGTEKEFYAGNLKRGLSRSCGCLKAEMHERQKAAPKVGWTAEQAAAYNKEYRKKHGKRLRAAKRAYNLANKEAISEGKKRCYRAKKEHYINKAKAYYENNKEEILVSRVEYAKKNAEKISAYLKEYNKEYIKKNPEYRRLRSANYRANLLNATPGWVDFDAVKEVYAYAKFLTDTTGVPYEVDHVIPLNEKNVCGLHFEGNMQVITKEENAKKSNKLIESY